MINQKTIAIIPSPEKLNVTVVGCGAIGSKVLDLLTRLGLERFTLWDFDKVVLYNVGNQAFLPSDVDEYKVDACKRFMRDIHPGCLVNTHAEYFDGTLEDEVDYLFIMVDSMKARKQIFEDVMTQCEITGQRFNVIDTRMALEEVSIYSFNTGNKTSIEDYKKTLYSDDKVAPEFKSVCGTVQGLGTISHLASAMAVQKLVQLEQKKIQHGESIINMGEGYHAVEFVKKYKIKGE